MSSSNNPTAVSLDEAKAHILQLARAINTFLAYPYTRSKADLEKAVLAMGVIKTHYHAHLDGLSEILDQLASVARMPFTWNGSTCRSASEWVLASARSLEAYAAMSEPDLREMLLAMQDGRVLSIELPGDSGPVANLFTESRRPVVALCKPCAHLETEVSWEFARLPSLTDTVPQSFPTTVQPRIDGPDPPGTLWMNAKPYPIPPIPFRLLEFMWPLDSAPIEAVSDYVWGHFASDQALNAALNELTQAMALAGLAWRYGRKSGLIVKKPI